MHQMDESSPPLTKKILEMPPSSEQTTPDGEVQGNESKETDTNRDVEARQTPPKPPRTMSLPREIAFVFCICMANLLALAGLAQSIAPLPAIGWSFGVSDPGRLSWYSAAFSVGVGSFVLPAGRLGDMYGHRDLYIAGLLWYALWSLIAGVSVYSTDDLFIVARAFQGLGPATLAPNGLAILGRAYATSNRKNIVFPIFGVSATVGWTLGAVFSSVLAELAWWPWAYWVLALVCVGTSGLVLLVISRDSIDTSKRGRFDTLGCLTGLPALVLIIFAWSQGAVVGWATVYTYVLLIVGILLAAAFFVVELRYAKAPLLPLIGMKAEVGLALAILATTWASFGIWVYYLFQLLEYLRGYSILSAVAQNSPVVISGLLTAFVTAILLSRLPVPWVLLISAVFFLIGQVVLATTSLHQAYWRNTFVSIIILPVGTTMSFSAATVLIAVGTPKEHQGIAASLANTTVNLSISLGLGIAATIVRYVDGDVFYRIRCALFFATALDALAVIIALAAVLRWYLKRP